MPVSIVRIRAASEGDAAALARLAEQTFRDTFAASNSAENMRRHCEATYGESLQLAEIRTPEMETWLVEDDDRLVAYTQLRRGAGPAAVRGPPPAAVTHGSACSCSAMIRSATC